MTKYGKPIIFFTNEKNRASSGTAGISVSEILPLTGTGMPKTSGKIAVLSED
jgi:hypothetical protein